MCMLSITSKILDIVTWSIWPVPRQHLQPRLLQEWCLTLADSRHSPPPLSPFLGSVTIWIPVWRALSFSLPLEQCVFLVGIITVIPTTIHRRHVSVSFLRARNSSSTAPWAISFELFGLAHSPTRARNASSSTLSLYLVSSNLTYSAWCFRLDNVIIGRSLLAILKRESDMTRKSVLSIRNERNTYKEIKRAWCEAKAWWQRHLLRTLQAK